MKDIIMNVEVEFTDDEIREELSRLGYVDVPLEKLAEFKKDLMKLIRTERSKNNSLSSSADDQKHEKGSDSLVGNSTNNRSKGIGNEFVEDWHYQEEYKTHLPADKAFKSRGSKVPGSYALFEMPEQEQTNQNCCIKDDVSETDSERRYIKRKTSRRAPNGCRTVDESFCDSETSGIFEIYERIKNMAMRDCECGKSRPTTAESEPPYRIKGKNKNPSLIRKQEPPHTRNLVRTIPFDRLRMYEKIWKAQPAIGDDSRFSLRKAVRAKMLQKDDIAMDRKVYVPNQYVVPTDKRRLALRWQVRQCLEKYELPPHGFFHEI